MRKRPPHVRHPARRAANPSLPTALNGATSHPTSGSVPQPNRPIPRVLDRAIRTTAAALPTLGDDPATHLNAVIDVFEAFNPQTVTDTMLVSRFLLVGGAAEGLQQRAIAPDLPAVLAERLTRTALSALRTQERILRLLSQDSAAVGADQTADPTVWALWRQDLLHREERDRAATEQRAARDAEAARAIKEAGTAIPAQPHSHDPMQSGEPVEPMAEHDGWQEEDRHDCADLARSPHHAAETSTTEATAAAVRAHAVLEAHAP